MGNIVKWVERQKIAVLKPYFFNHKRNLNTLFNLGPEKAQMSQNYHRFGKNPVIEKNRK